MQSRSFPPSCTAGVLVRSIGRLCAKCGATSKSRRSILPSIVMMFLPRSNGVCSLRSECPYGRVDRPAPLDHGSSPRRGCASRCWATAPWPLAHCWKTFGLTTHEPFEAVVSRATLADRPAPPAKAAVMIPSLVVVLGLVSGSFLIGSSLDRDSDRVALKARTGHQVRMPSSSAARCSCLRRGDSVPRTRCFSSAAVGTTSQGQEKVERVDAVTQSWSQPDLDHCDPPASGVLSGERSWSFLAVHESECAVVSLHRI